MVLSDARCTPPVSIVSETYERIATRTVKWRIWKVHLPSDPTAETIEWLERLDHEFIPRPWSLILLTPPRQYGERDEPIFWVGDRPVLALESPQPNAAATISFESNSNLYSTRVSVDQNCLAFMSASVTDSSDARVTIVGEKGASLTLTFIRPPLPAALGELLTQTARVRIQYGPQTIEAWQAPTHLIRLPRGPQPEVAADLGDETVRARVTSWVRAKQRFKRGLDSRRVAKAVQDALPICERVEIDAGNLGRVVLLPENTVSIATGKPTSSDRLRWHTRVVSLRGDPESKAAALIQSRLGLRRRHGEVLS